MIRLILITALLAGCGGNSTETALPQNDPVQNVNTHAVLADNFAAGNVWICTPVTYRQGGESKLSIHRYNGDAVMIVSVDPDSLMLQTWTVGANGLDTLYHDATLKNFEVNYRQYDVEYTYFGLTNAPNITQFRDSPLPAILLADSGKGYLFAKFEGDRERDLACNEREYSLASLGGYLVSEFN